MQLCKDSERGLIKMKKRLLTLVVAGILLISTTVTSFGADNTVAGTKAEEAVEVKSFTLQQAIDYALENSTQLKKLNADIKIAGVDARSTGSKYGSMKDESLAFFQELSRDTSGETIVSYTRVKEGYYKEATKMAVRLNEKGEEMATEGIKFSVEQSYFGVLHAQENLDIQKSVLNAAKQNLDAGNKKLALGLVSEIEAMTFEIDYSQAEIAYKSAQRELEYAKMSFNKVIGVPLDTKVALTEKIAIEAPEEVDLDAKVSEALENRMEMITAQEQYELSQLDYEILKGNAPGTYGFKTAVYTLDSNENELSETKKEVELSVQKAYMDMMDAYEGLTILDKTIVQVEKVYDATKKRYEVGMATENDVIESLNQLAEIKLQRAEVALGYNLAKKMFKVSYGIGLSAN